VPEAPIKSTETEADFASNYVLNQKSQLRHHSISALLSVPGDYGCMSRLTSETQATYLTEND